MQDKLNAAYDKAFHEYRVNQAELYEAMHNAAVCAEQIAANNRFALNQYHCPECDGTGGDWYGHKAGCSVAIARAQLAANSLGKYAAYCRDNAAYCRNAYVVLDESFTAGHGLYLPKWGKL